jgi:N,N'-diacetyllegionaminate synthase
VHRDLCLDKVGKMAITLIAEIGSVHDGSFGNATELIAAAAQAGAHAVKLQTHIAEAETLHNAPMPPYFTGEPRFEYFKRTSFSLDQWRCLAAFARDCGVRFLSSPFSLEAVDLLESVGIDAFKIPSGEVSNIPLLERVAATGKPILLSSGMSNWNELDVAVETLGVGGPITVMQCSSTYPCPPEAVGLNVIAEMRDRYKTDVGFSDHTLGIAAPLAAAVMGASVIEKHFTFSRLMYGSDARHSMEPKEFRQLAQSLGEIDAIVANPVDKNDLDPFLEMKVIFEKSVVAKRRLPAGHRLVKEDLAFKKPGTGIPAARYRDLIGRCLKTTLDQDEMFQFKHLS